MAPPTNIGNYKLGALLGRGGVGDVFAAEHRFLGDGVAVKLLRPAYADDAEHRSSFLEEAARTRDVQHPNVIRVLDFGHDDSSGCCYLVMERIDGQTLAAHLRAVGRMEEPALRELAAQIADGMQAAHARGIVHRDLKPGNVMLRGAHPMIVDFGIAKSVGASGAAITERRVGTVAYMAPEQLTDGLITPAVDIWALGVILYEAATGRLPFDNFHEGRLPQLFDAPPRARTLTPISAALDDLIARCLERDPAKRPATMADIARTLRGASAERVTEDIGGLAPAARVSRRRWPWLVAAIAAVGCAGIAAVVALRGDDAPRASASVTAPAPPRPAPPVVEAPVATPAVVEAPIAAPAAPVEPRPVVPAKHKRAKPRPKKHTTSQGETLD